MAEPSFYTDGTTNRKRDPRLRRWKKILGAYQNRAGGGDPTNNPRRHDGLRRTQLKTLNSIRGAATN